MLVIGSFYLVGAMLWLSQSGTETVAHFVNGIYGSPQVVMEKVTPTKARVYGLLSLMVALLICAFYFKLRSDISRNKWRNDKTWRK